MRLEFGGALKDAVLNKNLPNKRAHAALVNVYLKAATDSYMTSNQRSGHLNVTPPIAGLLREATGLDPAAYEEWIATVSAEILMNPEEHAQKGYVVPWDGVTQHFLQRVWEKGDNSRIMVV